jgi:hypothetical protein
MTARNPLAPPLSGAYARAALSSRRRQRKRTFFRALFASLFTGRSEPAPAGPAESGYES